MKTLTQIKKVAIEGHQLPVTHETARQGRPFTLLLTKQRALFRQAAMVCAEQQRLLAWLRGERAAFAAP